nr:immunoglobulin heavy chain junction region [Mus musculus]MBK4187254.1 immunoglobulin heavy chain junction region [Mus musculus]MBK4187258.1 immunoglobulin heavy chain junction region [Mus musculus]
CAREGVVAGAMDYW